MAYWSQKPPGDKNETDEVDVYFATSTDHGTHWTEPLLANRAGTGEETSYPSATPMDAMHAALIWLDGSNWKKQKRVALMSRTVQSDGTMTPATALDPDTCTCCPTALVRGTSGLLAAYRGHNSENIRDISLIRNVEGRWTQPVIPRPDNWHFEGCPVNGPHLDVEGQHSALIWFSAPQDQPAVKIAFSNDADLNFGPPVRIDQGNATGELRSPFCQEAIRQLPFGLKINLARRDFLDDSFIRVDSLRNHSRWRHREQK
jgi:hypothetical protein